MATNHSVDYRLNDEERARVQDCLTKDGVSLPRDRFERLVHGLEGSIQHFLTAVPEGNFRDSHNALRDLWQLSHQNDPPVGVIRARIQSLPEKALERLELRWPRVMAALFPAKGPTPRFQTRAASADREMLIAATRALSAEGERIVPGRSRGAGKRSAPRLEPFIMGETRGAGTRHHHGGRPKDESYQSLIMRLALDWLSATGEPPKSGRSDHTGFGDLCHCVFQWLNLPEGSATHALRQYWTTVKKYKALEPLKDFLRRHGEEP